MTKVINLFGEPGAGKSTTRAGVFSQCKLHGVICEEAYEYAKEATWEKKQFTLTDQPYVFGKQYHRQWILQNQCDVIITDSPLPLSLVYGDHSEASVKYIMERFNEFDNENYFIVRDKPYQPIGRNQTEKEAMQVREDISKMLLENGIQVTMIKGNWRGINIITNNILDSLGIAHQVCLGECIESDL